MKTSTRTVALWMLLAVSAMGPRVTATPPADNTPLVLHVLRSRDNAAEPWLHDTTAWFVGQKKKSIEVVFIDKPRQDAPNETENKTSNPVANHPPRSGPGAIHPDLVLLEVNAEPALYGATIPADAQPLLDAQLVIAQHGARNGAASLQRMLRGEASAAVLQPPPESTAGLYALYLESLADANALQDRTRFEKRVAFATLETLLGDKNAGRDKYLLIPDTWCGTLSSKGRKLAARAPKEGTVRLRIVGFVPAGGDPRRAKLAHELLHFFVQRANSDPPLKCVLAKGLQRPAVTPSVPALRRLYSEFRKNP